MIVKIPAGGAHESAYAVDVVMREYLGIHCKTVAANNTGTITIEEDDKRLELSGAFFARAEQSWLHPSTLPELPVRWWDGNELGRPLGTFQSSAVPVLYGEPSCRISEKCIQLGIDLFGSIFFMLSRYEEAVRPERDRHDRFPVRASIAWQEGFLDRPIVNEYTEVLWTCLKRLWPGLERRRRSPRKFISCDVDVPYSPFIRSLAATGKKIVNDIILRRDLPLAVNTMMNTIASRRQSYRYDRYDTFQWIMDMNELAGNELTFFFIADHTGGAIDGCYSLDEPRIRSLMRHIHQRGHKIGLHCSYHTYKNAEQTVKEAGILKSVLLEEGIDQGEMGCRQHYLRWSPAGTARNLEAAGFTYDSTLTFAEHAGFRCGTCIEYPMYDLEERRAMTIRQRPLVIMEGSVLQEQYMNMGYTNEALDFMQDLKAKCAQYSGEFTLLWHNNFFFNGKDKEFYVKLLQ